MKLFEGYPSLGNGEVLIRRMTPENAGDLAELTADTRVYETLPTFLYELKYEDKAEVIARMDDECFRTGEGILLGIYPADGPEQLIGIAEIYNYEEHKSKASIGYRLNSRYWGRGFATQVTALLREYLLKEAGLDTITAHVLSDNRASARVLEKNGFVNRFPDLLEDWGYPELMPTDKYIFRSEWLDASGHETPAAEKKAAVQVEQFVMAYEAEQDRIRAMLPEGFRSLRPVLRINAEILDGSKLYVEFNTPVEADGRRGWLNIANWKSTHDPVTWERDGKTVRIRAPFLKLDYTGTGITGGCPAEQDNEGCYYLGNDVEFRPDEVIRERKEFCDCEFRWKFHPDDAHGISQGRTIPAYDAPVENRYEPCALTAENAAAIPCRQVLGAYIVSFARN